MDQTVLPPGWKLKPIGKLGKIYSGSTPSTNNKAYWDGDINWITPNDLSDLQTRYIHSSERRITKAGLKNSVTHVLPANSLVISSRAPIGYLALPTKEFCTNQGCKSIVFNEEHDPEFHYYNILFRVKLLKDKGHGTTFAEISKKALAQIEMPIPDNKKEQTKIAEVLTTIDRAIAQTEALIAKHQRIKTGLMQDLLTRGIDEHGQLRDESTHKFKSTPLGMIPVEWEVKTFESFGVEIIDSDRGTNYPSENELNDQGFCVFLNNKNIFQGALIFDGAQFVSAEKDAVLGKGKLKKSDLVITTRGTVGNIALYKETDPFDHVRINSGMVVVRNYKHLCLSELFVYQWLNFFPQQYNLIKSGSAQPQLPIKDLKKFYLLKPVEDEQNRIVAALNNATNNINLQTAQLGKLHKVKNGLMQDLLSGEVSVTPLMEGVG